MDAACSGIPACETIRTGAATAETMAGLITTMESDPKYPALKALIEKEGTKALADLADEANILKGGLSKFGKTLQAVSPSLMRQCMACVLGAPKGVFGDMLTAAQAKSFDGWQVKGGKATDVCTIGLGSGLFSEEHFITLAATGKKAILLDAYVDTFAGASRYKADVKLSIAAGIKKAELKGSMTECEVEAEMIFSSFSIEVINARKFWNTASWKEKKKDCKLANENEKSFSGKAWAGC